MEQLLEKKYIWKHQTFKVAAAPGCVGDLESSHIKLLLELWWLPISCQVHFKKFVITFKTVSGLGWSSLQDYLLEGKSTLFCKIWERGLVEGCISLLPYMSHCLSATFLHLKICGTMMLLDVSQGFLSLLRRDYRWHIIFFVIFKFLKQIEWFRRPGNILVRLVRL